MNFGHTFGHAIEKIAGISHGNAVSLGMVISARFSYTEGHLSENDLQRIINLLKKLELPVLQEYDTFRILEALVKDKKREGEKIHFVLLQKIGQAVVEELPLDVVKKILNLKIKP